MDTGQKTESVLQLVQDIVKDSVALPEFQRDFVWDIEKTFDLFDSFVRDIFVGSLIYGVPTFEITVREIDKRPRSGRGSRTRLGLRSFSKEEIEKRVKVNGFRLLLDGQQRATSIYRAMTGVDPVYFVARNDNELSPDVVETPVGQRSLESVLSEFRGEPVEGHVSIRLQDVHRVLNGEITREKEKAEVLLSSNILRHLTADNVEASTEFLTFLTQMKNLENLFRQEKLVAYYLLDTDEEKFALFFERSNSKGMQLNFIDILAAKLYAGFNLRAKIQEFEEENPSIDLNREVVVRAISFHVSQGKEMGRNYILSSLSHVHFNEHWESFTSAYKSVLDYLISSRLVIHPAWMPYENMLLPLLAFASNLHRHDFSQITAKQARVIRCWYWLATFSRRYSSAAQTYALEDAQALAKAASGHMDDIILLINRMQSAIREADDLLVIHKKYDAVYKGVLNLVNFHTGGYLNLDNGNPVSASSNLEDHHIFPKDYLRKNWAEVHDTLDSEAAVDCVINRTLIAKLTNIKVSNKPPSKYLLELNEKNPKIARALESHLISKEILDGEYDTNYDYYLTERADNIMTVIREHVFQEKEAIVKEHGTT